MSRMLPVKILPPSPPSTAPVATLFGQESEFHGLQALLVGVQSFGCGLGELPGAPRDVYQLYLELSHRTRYRQTCATPLTNPTRAQFVEEFRGWVSRCQKLPPTVLLLYLSTHGIYQDGQYHLSMSDSSVEEGRYRGTVTWPEIRTWLAPLRQHRVVVVLDCCRQQGKSCASQLPETREDISLRGENWAVLTAAAFGEMALEQESLEEGPQGLFSHSFLRGLQENSLQELPLHILFEEIRCYLQEHAKKQGWQVAQEPRLYVGHFEVGESILLRKTEEREEEKASLYKPSLWLTAVMMGVVLFLVGWFSWSRQPSQSQCTQTIQQHWSTLRAREYRDAIVGLPRPSGVSSTQTLPCNLANIRSALEKSREACKQNTSWMRTGLENSLKGFELTASQRLLCQLLFKEADFNGGSKP